MAGKLETILAEMYDQTLAQGQSTRTLFRGLRVEMRINIRHISLTLTREGTTPSLREWHTILKYWPYPVTDDKLPDSYQQGKYRSLHGTLPVRSVAER